MWIGTRCHVLSSKVIPIYPECLSKDKCKTNTWCPSSNFEDSFEGYSGISLVTSIAFRYNILTKFKCNTRNVILFIYVFPLATQLSKGREYGSHCNGLILLHCCAIPKPVHGFQSHMSCFVILNFQCFFAIVSCC